MNRQWKIKTLPPEKQVIDLAVSLGVHQHVAALLLQRGIDTFDEAKKFFRPSLDELHDPFLMKDMETAVQRLGHAIDRGEKIMVYGDYDVDGTTAVSIVYGYLSGFSSQLSFYIPDRYTEGYGVSASGIEKAASSGVRLIISLDCGVKDAENIALASSHGIDFIVCDHHLPGRDPHPAYALLDPKRLDCPYPYKELSGAGVGFKLMQAYAIRNGLDQNKLFEYLDLLAVSVAADIVPITGENRVFAFHGLERINSAPRPGIKSLINVADLKNKLQITNLVFGLGPRINAAGRIHHGGLAVQLLLSKDASEAENLAFEINKHNLTRRDFDTSITDEALAMIREDEAMSHASSTVLFKEDWHKGVIGIVASRCIEQYYRPTVIFTRSNGKATGSARSVEGFDLHAAISECADLVDRFGGHMHAAGITMPLENIPLFRKKFDEVVRRTISDDQLTPKIHIDIKISLEDITDKLYRIISQMGPFGPENMQPIFITENLRDNGNAMVLKDKHLKVFVKQGESPVFEAIGWDMAGYYDEIKAGTPFDLCYQLHENEFNGSRKLQLMIKDIRPAV